MHKTSQFSSGHVTTSKSRFKLRFDRTEQTRLILKANEESVNSQFSSRVKKAQNELAMGGKNTIKGAFHQT